MKKASGNMPKMILLTGLVLFKIPNARYISTFLEIFVVFL